MKTRHGTFSGLKLLSTVVVLAALLMPSTGSAQDVAVGQATATVLAILTVTATSPLAFGNVYQGVPTAIAKDNADAGIFRIVGEEDAVVAIYFQLPDYLSTATGDDRMVISFSTTDLNVDTTAANTPAGFVAADGWIDQDPHNVTSAADIGSTATDLYLGGEVIPSVDQTAGAYTGDVVLTVAYTGT